MARWSAAVLVFCLSAAASALLASAQPLPGNAMVISNNTRGVIRGKRNSMFTCADTKKKRPGCVATCPNRCPTKCLVLCPTCKTFCLCDFYPGVSCGDPRFTGGDGNNFYFHGKKDQDFCILSDANLHINAHFIGNHNPELKRDFTWIQALGILFGTGDHALHLGAVTAARWDPTADHLNITFDDERVVLPPSDGARWSPASVPALSVTRTAQVNTVVVELKGVFRIMANAVPITKEESQIHNYGVTDDDCLVHLDLGFKFQALTDDVHGVLGQTYRADYVNRLNVSAKMPIMGGADTFISSGLFATDCAVARFGRRGSSTAGIAMVIDDDAN